MGGSRKWLWSCSYNYRRLFRAPKPIHRPETGEIDLLPAPKAVDETEKLRSLELTNSSYSFVHVPSRGHVDLSDESLESVASRLDFFPETGEIDGCRKSGSSEAVMLRRATSVSLMH